MSASSIIKPVTTTAQIYGYIRDAALESNRKTQQSNAAILIRILTCKCRDEEMDNELEKCEKESKGGRKEEIGKSTNEYIINCPR